MTRTTLESKKNAVHKICINVGRERHEKRQFLCIVMIEDVQATF